MRTNGTSIWLKRLALLILISASIGSAVSAQTPQGAEGKLETTLMPGMTVWITDSGGREEKARIVGLSGDIVTATAGNEIRRLHRTDVMRVRVRHSDPVINGALIGAGAAVASGLFVCTRMETWENCRDDVGPMVRIGAIGAGIGIGIDALIPPTKDYLRSRAGVNTAARRANRRQSRPRTAGVAQFLSADTQLFIQGFRDRAANEALQEFHRVFAPFEYSPELAGKPMLETWWTDFPPPLETIWALKVERRGMC